MTQDTKGEKVKTQRADGNKKLYIQISCLSNRSRQSSVSSHALIVRAANFSLVCCYLCRIQFFLCMVRVESYAAEASRKYFNFS